MHIHHELNFDLHMRLLSMEPHRCCPVLLITPLAIVPPAHRQWNVICRPRWVTINAATLRSGADDVKRLLRCSYGRRPDLWPCTLSRMKQDTVWNVRSGSTSRRPRFSERALKTRLKCHCAVARHAGNRANTGKIPSTLSTYLAMF